MEGNHTVAGRNPFCGTLKSWETIVCWYLLGNRIIPLGFSCEMEFATIHSFGLQKAIRLFSAHPLSWAVEILSLRVRKGSLSGFHKSYLKRPELRKLERPPEW